MNQDPGLTTTPSPLPSSRVDWPPPLAPGPAGSHCGECHSLGCNVHSSHMLLWDQPRSGAAECHPAENKNNKLESVHFLQTGNDVPTCNNMTVSKYTADKGNHYFELDLFTKADETRRDKTAHSQGGHVSSCSHSHTGCSGINVYLKLQRYHMLIESGRINPPPPLVCLNSLTHRTHSHGVQTLYNYYYQRQGLPQEIK